MGVGPRLSVHRGPQISNGATDGEGRPGVQEAPPSWWPCVITLTVQGAPGLVTPHPQGGYRRALDCASGLRAQRPGRVGETSGTEGSRLL